jgi:hypothetical protein
MRDIKLIDQLTLSAVNYTPIAFGGKAIHELRLQLQAAAACYISFPTTYVTKYWTIKNGAVLSLDLAGRNMITPSLGDELVTNGTFTGNATGWTFSAVEWTYNANAMDKDADGILTLYQALSISALHCYKLSYSITVMGVQGITPSLGGTSGTLRTATGDFVDYIVTTNATGALTFTPSANASRFTLDDVSVKEVTNYVYSPENILLVLAAAATPVLEIIST